MERIGGHPGMDVYRLQWWGRTIIEKQAHDAHNSRALSNEFQFLRVMEGSGYTPAVVPMNTTPNEVRLCQEDVGDNEGFTDGEMFRHRMIRALHEIRRRGIRHGDLTSRNIIVRHNHPWIIDWQESHFIGDPAPQKQPWTDSWLMCRELGTWAPSDGGTADTPRVARRWMAILEHEDAITHLGLPLAGKTLIDFGTFQGDFVALAAAEGMIAQGIDRGGFRSGEDSIEIGRRLWDGLPNIDLKHGNIMKMEGPELLCDIALLFSTFAYMVGESGAAAAEAKLREIMLAAGTLYFETQLAGDGPGPAYLRTDEDVYNMLDRLGAEIALPITTIPVVGRDATRTVWRVRT